MRFTLILLLVVLVIQVAVDGQVARRTRARTNASNRNMANTGARVSNRRSLPGIAPIRPLIGVRVNKKNRKQTTPNPNIALRTSLTTRFQSATAAPIRVVPPRKTATTMRVLPSTPSQRRPIPNLAPPPLRGFKVSTALSDAPPAIRPPPGVAKKLNMADINDFMRLARFMLRRRRTQRKIQRPPKF
ncbi:unnamed protein product [Bursaphelenchus okinawaensis]|uniref:Uncharacterized protein n=1 Tax=Bursaphelenchus okinawaensis TaxID=465554 RepID=A0A811KC27_9BILA|nr:unnamed protein product [Bursaphelenchus okinawaensis]CAG9100656.1 unnamed protein product [Bursaphelenchus okinawaensis]